MKKSNNNQNILFDSSPRQDLGVFSHEIDKTADEVQNEYRFFAEFLNSEEGKKLIPKT